MKKTKSLLLSLILVLVLTIVGCSGSTGTKTEGTAVSTKDTLIVATNAGPVDLDPHGTNDQNTYDVRFQIYEPLVSIGVEGNIEPCLATEWEWVDNNTINFTLRDGVKFHNGNDLTAEDVVYSIQRASTSPFTSSDLVNVIIDECKALEDGRVQFKLEVPVGALLTRIAKITIIDKETWEETPEEELLEKPIGTGPFKFVKWFEGDRIEFEAFEDYWGGQPAFKYLTLRIIPESAARALEIEAGTVDISTAVQASDVEILEANEDVKIYSSPSYMITYMGFDANVEPYNNVLVRQALSYAIDREAICENVYAGLAVPASYGRLSPVYRGYTEDGVSYYEYNPEKAKQLLAEAGYPNGFEATLALSEAEQDQIDMSEIIQNQLGQVGIKVKIDIIENATFLNMIVDGGFDMFLLNSTGSGGDAGEALKSFIATRPTWSNTTRYYNDYLTALIEKGQQTIDETQKSQIFTEAQQIISQECPWIFLVHNTTTFAARKNIGGLVAYPTRYHYFKQAYLIE
jgi:peptide/nickel transport system substrate-binding protein